MSGKLPPGFDPNTTPSMIPPKGVTPNFVNGESISYLGLNAISACLPLLVIFLALRIYSRIRVGYKFGADDFLCVAAAANILAWFGILIHKLHGPYGHHLYDLPVSEMTESFLRLHLTGTVMYASCAMLVKVSLLVLYLRIFHPVYVVNRAIYACIGLVSVFYLVSIIYDAVKCTPAPGSQGGYFLAALYCAPSALEISVALGVFGLVSDVVILLIPMSLVLPMNLPRRKKIAVTCTFLTGFLACACSMVTCVSRIQYWRSKSTDYTWDIIIPDTFTVIELTVGHICCSLPTLPPLLTSLRSSERVQGILKHLHINSPHRQANSRAEDGKPSPSPASKEARHDDAGNQLPEIAAGRLTGLRSIIQRVFPSQTSQATGSNKVEDPSGSRDTSGGGSDVHSVDMDYHQHLRKGTGRSPV
ncbi:hypothetical protein B0T19DRAFT_199336 [Cercophora scortea]|uniref:Rhodopsin domain-containing protein n=1 Tax=Cercophora scortea TaxID=314031 RepID=A0AAE0M8G7_9PEZI|nr:hypothetical protein B0T19DRAFT_199336 [Cercophora scortea]